MGRIFSRVVEEEAESIPPRLYGNVQPRDKNQGPSMNQKRAYW